MSVSWGLSLQPSLKRPSKTLPLRSSAVGRQHVPKAFLQCRITLNRDKTRASEVPESGREKTSDAGCGKLKGGTGRQCNLSQRCKKSCSCVTLQWESMAMRSCTYWAPEHSWLQGYERQEKSIPVLKSSTDPNSALCYWICTINREGINSIKSNQILLTWFLLHRVSRPRMQMVSDFDEVTGAPVQNDL
ncbi:hypothetical protein JZ751_003846 [Albula glossodonta]|uniref:Uncharacterized protein n=1 Tax=Albula glossodonta TaxID=121402 RepID=A0A8T2P7G1_9TELE|nr:hypothetical protein JZ751_003846 [Albula glossodonta]